MTYKAGKKKKKLAFNNLKSDNLCNAAMITPRVHKCSKNLDVTSEFRCQRGDMKPVPYWGTMIMLWPMKLTIIWHFLLGASEMLHAAGRKDCSNYTKILGTAVQNLGLGNKAQRFCALLNSLKYKHLRWKWIDRYKTHTAKLIHMKLCYHLATKW